MSNILSYNNSTNKTGAEDWIPVTPYTDDDIKKIKDPNGGLSESPRTAIPSPFAQLDLVKNAFAHLGASDKLRGAVMDMRLVSNALDIAQLFFCFENHKDYLRVVRWNCESDLQALKASPAHRLYGETLELFLNSDKNAYNFDGFTDWYILINDVTVIGATSPASLTMAAPINHQIDSIMVEQGVSLFSSVRQLWERDEDFVLYMFLLFNAFPMLRQRLGGIYTYMLRNLDVIREKRTDLYKRISDDITNPTALDMSAADVLRQKLDEYYTPFNGDVTISVLGAQFYKKRSSVIRANVEESDFQLKPSRQQADGDVLPLVLRSNFDGSVDNMKYIDKMWNSTTEVLTGGVPVESRKLPDSSIYYPFVTTNDFLSDTIIQLSGPIDNSHYFDGNLKSRSVEPENGYLLPLTPLFFKYFNSEDLLHEVFGRKMIEITEGKDEVKVLLRIPMKKKYMELFRIYRLAPEADWRFNEKINIGRMIPQVRISTAVFPFVKTGVSDSYSVQLFSMVQTATTSLQFYANGNKPVGNDANGGIRSESLFTTRYYDIDATFDYFEVMMASDFGTQSGVVLPLWKPYTASSKELIFAVDFGTTNSHVEYAEKGQLPETITFNDNTEQELVATLLKKGALDQAETLMRVEFLPRDIDNIYGFPLRTALAINDDNNGDTKLFKDLNIPFLYERKYFAGYNVITSLKWTGNQMLSQEFLREIVLLIKAKVLLENASLANTHIVYFYPVSMSGNKRAQFNELWERLFSTYIGGDAKNLYFYPESIAPAYYYKNSAVAGSCYVSIDIGGGTSDVVVYTPTADKLKSEPNIISSFRFAGNAIFGDGFTQNDADNNPLLDHYTEYFKKLINKNDDLAYLNSILNEVMNQKRSEDINAFLFSIENVEELRKLREIDRQLYSYNALLRNDEHRKLIFLYFYSAIIYYICCMMKHRGLIMPKQVYFSGTGSKILNIIGNIEQIESLTKTIIERVFGQSYTEKFEIKIEKDKPKQITCKGGIQLENERLAGNVDNDWFKPANVNKLKYCYSMTKDETLTFGKVNELDTRHEIEKQVNDFNEFFMSLCTNEVKDEFGIDNKVLHVFHDALSDNIFNYLTAGINSYLNGNYDGPEEVIEDVPFFYPIIGIIRNNLLKQLCHEVISKL
ncbi:MAG: hypothetical protein LKF31_00655 [Muribaculaceae bacterium]|jgi:hypothetical protein|nr:hypothetical protein [Muribaculaceae bacterium]